MQAQAGGSMDAAFGFLTAVDSAAHGLFGGYLIVDGLGRPLEFHCTAPLKVSRAQQILYGPTLTAHLHGQQIGGTLLAAGGVDPVVVLTDAPALLHVRQHTRLPVTLVERIIDTVSATGPAGTDAGTGIATDCPTMIVIGATRIVSPAGTADAVATAAWRERLESLAASVDLCEPFERIRLAIDEAQRS
jgi:hypothetical protein